MPGAAGAAGARNPPPAFACATSRAITRPCGPEPAMRAISMFASLASRRASGDAKMRPWPLACGAGCAWAAARTGCGGGAAVAACGCGAGAAAGFAGADGCDTGAAACAGAGAAPLPALDAAAFTSSPSPASTAISWLTGTSAVPSGTMIFASTPSSTASYSIVALSVSISARISPVLTRSPSFLSHLARLPFSIVGESAGMRMLIGMVKYLARDLVLTWRLPVGHALGGLDDLRNRRQREFLEIGRIRHGHVLAGDANDRRIEIVEGVLHDARRDLGADARLRPALLDHDAASGLLDRLDDRGGVHRPDGAQIDHLGGQVFLRELLGGLEGVAHAHRPGHERHMLARPRDLGLADRHRIVVELRHRRRMAVENLILEEDHRARQADRRLEQAFGVGRRVRRDHRETGDVRVPGRIVLAVLGGDARRGAVRPAKDDRAAHLPARHIERLRGRVDQLIHGLHGEVEGHELDDRLQSGERGTDAEAREPMLGDRRVDHPVLAELLQ